MDGAAAFTAKNLEHDRAASRAFAFMAFTTILHDFLDTVRNFLGFGFTLTYPSAINILCRLRRTMSARRS